MSEAPNPRRESDRPLPIPARRRFLRRWYFSPAILLLGLAFFLWPTRQLRSDNFIFYLPSGPHMIPTEMVGGVKYLPLMQVLNLMGKVGGIQEKRKSLKVSFGTTQLDLGLNEQRVRVGGAGYDLPQPVLFSNSEWIVPLDFLTIVLPHLTHQAVEYQEGTNRIFVGDIKPASFTVRLDSLSNGVRITVQFTDKVTVQTASSNGKWILYLGDHPMEPMEPSYHFRNPYVSDMQYDDQDGVPKLIISPTSGGLNFYPLQAEGGKILLADIIKPPTQTTPAPAPSATPPGGTPTTPSSPGGPAPQVTEEVPATPPGPPLPVVALDAGHGGTDNGGRSRDGIWEKDLTAQLVARVRSEILATNKYRVVLSRTGDVNVSFDQRALAANLSSAIYFLSFHAGDLGTPSACIALFTYQPSNGAPAANETVPPLFTPWGQVQETHVPQSVKLALALQQQFSQMNEVVVDSPMGAPVRTLRSVNAPAVAIEIGRLAPDQDATTLTNPAFQQQVATGVVQALAAYEKGGE